jgi:hypothetical protein
MFFGTIGHMSSLRFRFLLTLLFVTWADVLLYGHAFGCNITLLALPLGCVVAFVFRDRIGREKPLAALWLLLAVGASVESSLIGRGLLVLLGWTMLARIRLSIGTSFLDGLIRGTAGGVRSLSRGPSDARRYLLFVASQNGFGLPPLWVFALPILLVSVFAVLIIPANLVLAQWTMSGFDHLGELLTHVSFGRLFFWVFTALAVYGLFRFRVGRRLTRERPAAPVFTEDEVRNQHLLKACLLTFSGLNLLYLLSNTVDAFFLWFGFELPDGMTYADFAHQGSYCLMVAAVLSAVTVTFFLPSGSRALKHGKARLLAYAFVVQNLIVLAAATRRLELYMEGFGLTRFRLAAVLWMLLVGVGFLLILARIRGSRPIEFLFRTNAVSALVLLSVVALWNTDGFIADWNVDRYESGQQEVVDVGYLGRLEAGAFPALVRLGQIAQKHDDRQTHDRVTATLRRRAIEERRLLDVWQSWTYRRSHSLGVAESFLR